MQTIEEKYIAIQMIGKGAFGMVVVAKDKKTGDKVAIKCEPRDSRYLENEAMVISVFYHLK